MDLDIMTFKSLGDLPLLVTTNHVPLRRPPLALAENGLNSEQVSLMRPIYMYIEKCILVLKQGGLNSEGGLNTRT